MSFLHSVFAKIALVVSAVLMSITGAVPAQNQVPVAVPATTTVSIETKTAPAVSTNTNSPSPSQAPTRPASPVQQPGGITCNNKYYPPCTDGGQRVCLDDGSNAYCRPQQSTQVQPAQNTPQTLAPQAVSQPPANSSFCNGKYWSQCSAGSSFVCPQTGDAYCQTNTVTPTPSASVTQNVPQPIEQIWMAKFLADASAASNSIQLQANNMVSSASNASDCSAAVSFSGWISAVCTYSFQGVAAIGQLQSYANSVQNQYRSSSCDQQLYSSLEQALKAEQDGITALINNVRTPTFLSNQQARASQITTLANSQVSAALSQAQGVVSTCK
jgi:hypothetical protein